MSAQPYSRSLALLLLLVGLLLASTLIAGCSPSPAATQPAQTQPAPQPTSQPATPLFTETEAVAKAVNNFYTSYDSCMKNPPAESEGKVSEYCQNNTGLTTAAFASNLEAGGTSKAGADPVFCAQDIPGTMSVNTDMKITADKATASVLEKFGTTQINIQVDLVNENGTWKIDNIICPLP